MNKFRGFVATLADSFAIVSFLSERFWKLSLSGLMVGLVCIVCGVILFFHGVTGSSNWTAKALGVESKLSGAAPGVVLFLVGLYVVYITNFSITTRKESLEKHSVKTKKKRKIKHRN